MKKVLYYHPVGFPNIGDDITFHGSVNIMKSAIGDHDINIFFTEDLALLTDEKLKELSQMDILVLGGTPWLWDRCELSVKYLCFKKVLELFNNKPKIALGIGSCYALNLYPNEYVSELKSIWESFNFISTRDSIASSYLCLLGVYNYNTFCTSSFYPNYKYSIRNNELGVVFYNPKEGVSQGVLTPEYIDNYNNYQISIIKKYSATAFVLTNEEQNFLRNHNIEAHKFVDHFDVINKLSTVSTLVSGRIHSAIPARMMGVRTFILPVDSRWLTSVNFGIIPLEIGTNLELCFNSFEVFNYADTIKNEKDKIVSLIKKSL
jgi:hypothetical protein